MLNNIYDEEAEITTEGYTKTVDPLTSENAIVATEEPRSEELDKTTAEALRVRARLFNGNDVRIVQDNNKDVWFVADDVVKILGYTKDTATVIRHHCNKVYDTKDLEEGKELAKKVTVKTNGGMQAMIAISEPDLYRLIMRSHMPEARSFEKWVVEDVLPSIRKTGKYKVSRKIDYTPAEPVAKEIDETAVPEIQMELFPRLMPSVSLPADVADRLNTVKKKLFEQGHSFPNNKEFVKFLVNKALEELEDSDVSAGL